MRSRLSDLVDGKTMHGRLIKVDLERWLNGDTYFCFQGRDNGTPYRIYVAAAILEERLRELVHAH